MANKLELTWYGKDKPIVVEPRLLIENAALSNCGGDPDTENMLIHGDNLLALKALEGKYAGMVKCILKGQGEYNDNGAISMVGPGDMTFVNAEEGHSMKALGNEALEMIALVLYV